MKPIWIVDDDESIRWVLEKALARENLATKSFANARDAIAALEFDTPQVLVSDIRMPGASGLELLQTVKSRFPGLPVIIITAFSDLDSAVAAFQGGAFEYLAKPFDIDKAVELIRRALEESLRETSVESGPSETPEILGQAPAMQEVFRAIGRLSQSNVTVLITGESGSGKELVARALHKHSPRAAQPFIALNTAAIPKDLLESELFGHERGAFTGAQTTRRGRFEQAENGTLFLDEIGDMPFGLQARLLRVLQERMVTPLGSSKSITVNVELICATNHNLRERMAKGLFREDLYYRLNGLVVKLPPLRERTDLDTVVKKILATEAPDTRYTVAPDILRMFHQHKWPGNFRQLTNLLRTAIVMAGDEHEICLRHMPDDFLDDIEMTQATAASASTDRMIAAGANLEEMEQSAILKSLDAHGGNVSATARALGVSRNTIYRKVPHLK